MSSELNIVGPVSEQPSLTNINPSIVKNGVRQLVAFFDGHDLLFRPRVPANELSLQQTAEQVGALVKKAFRVLALPYEQKSNPIAKEAQKQLIEWINKHLVIIDLLKIRKIEASNFGGFIGRVHSRASLDILCIVADFATWLFIYDDMIEKCQNKQDIEILHARTIRILNGHRSNETDAPLNQGLYDILRRINKVCRSSLWKQRFIDDIRDYCEGTLWEMANREKEKVPSLKQYQKMRPDTSGTKVMFDFIEFVEGFVLPRKVFESDYFKKIRLLGANLVNWENDLLSAPKEILNQDLHNLVFVHKEHGKISYDEAVQLTIQDLKEDLSAFLQLADNVPNFGAHTDNVNKYIRGVKEWVYGHHFWAKESPRYIIFFAGTD